MSDLEDALKLGVVGVGCAVLLGLLSQTLIAAWDSHRFVYHAWYATVGVLGVDPDVLVTAQLGLVLGVVIGTVLDQRTQLQGVILLIGGSAMIAALWSTWTETVSFGTYLPLIPVGALVGLAMCLPSSSGLPVIGSANERREVPLAGVYLYGIVLAGSVLGLVDRYVPYESPLIADNAPLMRSAAPPTALSFGVDVVVVVALLALVTYFVNYEDELRVVVSAVNPTDNDDQLATLVGGIALALPNTRRSEDAKRRLRDMRGLTDRGTLNERIDFAYRPDGVLQRWRNVSAEPFRTRDDDDEKLARRRRSRENVATKVVYALKHPLRYLVPQWLRHLGETGKSHVERLDEADVTLFTVPLSTVVDTEVVDAVTDGDSDLDVEDVEAVVDPPGEDLRSYLSVASECGTDDRKEAVAVVTEGRVAEQLLKRKNSNLDGRTLDLNGARISRFVKEDLLQTREYEFDLEGNCDIVVVDRPEGEREGDGFDELTRYF